VDNSVGAIVITCVLMAMFLICFFMNIFAIRVSNNLERYVLSPNDYEILLTGGSIKEPVLTPRDNDEINRTRKDSKKNSFLFWKKQKEENNDK
jgi:hypothetical protein